MPTPRLLVLFSCFCVGRPATLCFQFWSSDDCSGNQNGQYIVADGKCDSSNINVGDQDMTGYSVYRYDGATDPTCSGQAKEVDHYTDLNQCISESSTKSYVKWISTAGCTDLPGKWCCPAHSDSCSVCYASSTCGNKCYWFPNSFTRCQADSSGGSCNNDNDKSTVKDA